MCVFLAKKGIACHSNVTLFLLLTSSMDLKWIPLNNTKKHVKLIKQTSPFAHNPLGNVPHPLLGPIDHEPQNCATDSHWSRVGSCLETTRTGMTMMAVGGNTGCCFTTPEI